MTDIDKELRAFTAAWKQANNFGLAFTGKLPPLSGVEANEARDKAADLYWDGWWLADADRHHARAIRKAMIMAIEAARLEYLALGRPQQRHAELKEFLFERDGPNCWVCDKPLGTDATFEHKHALANGGTWAVSNLALAHRECNRDLGRLPIHAKEAACAAISRENRKAPEPDLKHGDS